jgi:acetyl-CoA acyltransferase
MVRRVAIIDGLRTPFAKSGTVYRDLTSLQLATAVVTELMQRSGIEGGQIDQVVFGTVVADVNAPNIAREVVLSCDMPETVDAYSVTRACATSTQAVVSAAEAILLGDTDIAIAGGVDSLSRPPVLYSDAFVDALTAANAAKDLPSKVKSFLGLRPKDLAPRPPAIADRSTGKTMGESAEDMARMNGISREDQDRYALESHQKAVEAWEKGIFDDEVMHLAVPPRFEETVTRDTIPRADTSLEKLSTLRPAFDRRNGSVTAGNSSPLTDGASAVLLMEAGKAEELGHVPKAYLRSWGFAAVDPNWQLLIGPAFATPIALDRAGLTLDQVDVIDMHEAFAAQILSNLQAFASDDFARERLGRARSIGVIDRERFNLYGGSVSIGHPFAATGTRQITTMANELVRRDSGIALVTQCAAGGLGAAVVLER